MKLEEAIETYKNIKKYKKIVANIDTEFFLKFTETVLQALEEYKISLIETKEANRQLSIVIKEKDKQIDYLRRSCDRKEQTLIEEQQDNADKDKEIHTLKNRIKNLENLKQPVEFKSSIKGGNK